MQRARRADSNKEQHQPDWRATALPNLKAGVRSAAFFFFFNDTATTEIYTLSLHDALPISARPSRVGRRGGPLAVRGRRHQPRAGRPEVGEDRKSTRLNSSHGYISYAVFCLKKKTRNPARAQASPHGMYKTVCRELDERTRIKNSTSLIGVLRRFQT